MSRQGETWVRHTQKYLRAVDPSLIEVFDMALQRAGYPKVAAATALEHLCADFLAGVSGSEATHPPLPPSQGTR